MEQVGTRGLSADQRGELWVRWKAGQSLSDIGRALGKHAASIFGVVASRGGIAPPVRRRSRLALTDSEREEISRGVAAGFSIRCMAAGLGRAPSTVSRELARNGGALTYRASDADRRAWHQARRPKPCLLATHRRLQVAVASRLALDWSPEQISGWLRREFPHDEGMRVSAETIYRSLFIQARGAMKKELIGHLRRRHKFRRSKRSTTAGQPRGQIVDAVSIRERPASVADRALPGHWEGDLICGAKQSYIATLVERRSRFTLLVKLRDKHTESVVTALARTVRRLPADLRRSLTWDRGTELAAHKRFTVATDVQVYFCDPQSPWQRGTNENTNGLLRQYFPKGTDLAVHSQAHLNKIARKLNQRPRKTLGFATPAEQLRAVLR